MPDEQCAAKAERAADIERVAEEVGDLHRGIQIDVEILPDEVRAVVAGREQGVFLPHRAALPQLHADGLHERRFAHRLHDAGRSEDGYPADDAEAGVERLFRESLALGRGDDHVQPAGGIRERHDLLHVLADHLPRHGVDGGVPDRLVEPALCHAADALAAVDMHARLVRPADRSKNERAFRHIGVVPAVLFDGAGDAVRAHRDLTHGELEPDALRRIERDGLLPPAGEQHPCRRLGRRRGARAGRISEPETLAVLFDVLFHITAGSDRAARCRWRRRRCCRPCGRGR